MRSPNAPPPPPKTKRVDPDFWGEPIVVKSASGWKYQWHEEVAERTDLSGCDRGVIGTLMHLYGLRGPFAQVSIDALAKRSGYKRRQTIRSTLSLRAKGLIEPLNAGARKADGQQEVMRYRLIYRDRGIT